MMLPTQFYIIDRAVRFSVDWESSGIADIAGILRVSHYHQEPLSSCCAVAARIGTGLFAVLVLGDQLRGLGYDNFRVEERIHQALTRGTNNGPSRPFHDLHVGSFSLVDSLRHPEQLRRK